jgi:hypothetical protein
MALAKVKPLKEPKQYWEHTMDPVEVSVLGVTVGLPSPHINTNISK